MREFIYFLMVAIGMLNSSSDSFIVSTIAVFVFLLGLSLYIDEQVSNRD